MSIEIRTRAVSYTHLDVYKRQMVVRKSRNTSGKQDYRQYKHLVQIKILHA